MARSRQKRTGGPAAESGAIFGAGEGGADGVGAALRAERERQGLQLAELAARLKIRRVHLAAIEDERFDQIPAGTYAVNFIRAYATALGLDAGEMVRRYRQALDGGQARLELNFPQPLQESRPPSGILIGASVVIAALAYGAWALFSEDRSVLPRVEPVPAQLQAVAPPPPPPAAPQETPAPVASAGDPSPPAMPSAPLAQPAAVAPVVSAAAPPAARPPVPAAPPPAAPPPAAPPPVPAPPGATSAPVPPPPQARPIAAPAPVPPPPQAPERTASEGARARVVITAQAESWVQVRDAAGTIVFMRILKAGEAYAVPNRRGLFLTTGNAGSIEVKVDGKPIPSLGRVGSVRRDLSLDAESLLEAGDGGDTARPASTPGGRSGG
jgi:cytoskeleton protein RodZ